MEGKYISHPLIILMINGVEYGATAFFSIHDMEYISEIDFEDKSIDYREITLSILRYHLLGYSDEKIEYDSVYDSDLVRYIGAYIESSNELKRIYFEIVNENIFTRYVLCLRKRTYELEKQMAENLRPVLQNFANTVKISMASIPKLEINTQLQESIGNLTYAYTNSMQESLAAMVQTITESIHRILPDYSKIIQEISHTVACLAESIRSPLLSEERKKELRDSFSRWGEYGWTLPPNADLSLFYDTPINEADAYRKIQPYVNKGGMQMLFDMLLQMKHIRKSDLKEAIADYDDKRYKSCIMILFSLIDARIIRLQETKESKNRLSGFNGANTYFNRIEAENMIEMTFADVLYKCFILASLSVVFAKGKDFRKQPNVVNRNFIDHGMFHRNVTQRDCKKIFLLLYNFTALVNDLAGYV